MVSEAVGYLIAIIGKLFGNLSYLFMKVANHQVEERKKEDSTKEVKAHCLCMWWIGFLCVFIGSILNLMALPFCPMVLFSTTMGISIVFNNVVAAIWLGEKIIWKYDLLAFFLLVGGSTAIILLSKDDDEPYTPADIQHHLTSTGTIIYLICTVVLIGAGLLSLKYLIDHLATFEKDV